MKINSKFLSRTLVVLAFPLMLLNVACSDNSGDNTATTQPVAIAANTQVSTPAVNTMFSPSAAADINAKIEENTAAGVESTTGSINNSTGTNTESTSDQTANPTTLQKIGDALSLQHLETLVQQLKQKATGDTSGITAGAISNIAMSASSLSDLKNMLTQNSLTGSTAGQGMLQSILGTVTSTIGGVTNGLTTGN